MTTALNRRVLYKIGLGRSRSSLSDKLAISRIRELCLGCPDSAAEILKEQWLYSYLMPKLIAGYPQNHKPLAAVPVVELVHLGVIPGRRASERRNIFD